MNFDDVVSKSVNVDFQDSKERSNSAKIENVLCQSQVISESNYSNFSSIKGTRWQFAPQKPRGGKYVFVPMTSIPIKIKIIARIEYSQFSETYRIKLE